MMKKNFFLFALAFSAILFVASCDNPGGDRDRDDDTTAVGNNEQWMQDRDNYLGERETETRTYEERRNQWNSDLENEKDTARRREIRTKIDELDREMAELREALQRTGDQTEENWDQFKRNVDKELDDVKAKIEEIENDLDNDRSSGTDEDTEDDDTRS